MGVVIVNLYRMKNRILNNWNWIRIIRLVIGLMILGSGIGGNDYLAIVIGLFFTVIPILNFSTCASGNCNIDTNKKYRICQKLKNY